MKKILLLIIVIVFNFSCVSNADGKLLKRDIAKIDARYKTLENKVNDDHNKMKRVFRRVDVKLLEIEKTLKEARGLLHKNNANFGQDVDSIDLRVKKVEGQNEKVLFMFGKLEKQFKELQERISDVNGNIAINQGDSGQNSGTNTVSKNDTTNSRKKEVKKSSDNTKKDTSGEKDYRKINNPNALFKLGYSYIEKKKHKNMGHKERMDMAIEIFEYQVRKYPTHKKSNSARYWITQAYYSSGQYEKAYKTLDKFLGKYPKSRHIPQVLFQMGNSLRKLDLIKDSRTVFKTLIKIYPKSGYSKQARVILKKL